ncbi:MAG: hypothetical protein JRH11_16300 [Deltaproteobacteria bacterium]|nr:hypothetical protein [Deltaproteobacteria bacterium]
MHEGGSDNREQREKPAQPQGGGTALILLTVVAAPVALGFETLLRKLLFPPEFEQIRALLHPILTPLVWGLVVITAVVGALGVVLQRRLVSRAIERVPPDQRDAARVHRAKLGAFMLAASVPQVPAILATFGFMWGSSLTPTVLAIAVATLAIALQAFLARSTERR